jgi:hypothetical protein
MVTTMTAPQTPLQRSDSKNQTIEEEGSPTKVDIEEKDFLA